MTGKEKKTALKELLALRTRSRHQQDGLRMKAALENSPGQRTLESCYCWPMPQEGRQASKVEVRPVTDKRTQKLSGDLRDGGGGLFARTSVLAP